MTAQAYFDAAARLQNLPIKPEHYQEALAAFEVLAEQGALVVAFPLPEDIEPAPRFTP